ncbi:exonuclease/endonuclease/phosphatase family protein [Saccharicrinis carchari]|nr:hypothetical protein [Saccharicrinis carchari]
MSKVKPDLISFEETEFTDSCLKHIESEGYQFMPVNTLKEDTQIKFSPIAIKKKSFDFLASSYYIYRNKTLQENKNMLTWYQLKNKHSGHIFYFFRLQLQDTIPSYHSKQIAFDLLKRIDEISAGVPVILMGDFKDSNVTVKKLLTDDWKGVYALSDVKTTNKNMEFLVNDFLKIVSFDAGAANDSLINKLVVRFSFSTGKIGKNTSGAIIPE